MDELVDEYWGIMVLRYCEGDFVWVRGEWSVVSTLVLKYMVHRAKKIYRIKMQYPPININRYICSPR
jgi:hypothetical protein